MITNLLKKRAKLAVIGLGYVGLPLALEFAKKFKVVGFEINPQKVQMLKKGIDPSQELAASEFKGRDILFTNKEEDLKDVQFFVVAVPTPIDDANEPDLKPLIGATKVVGRALKKGDYVVYESTVYPGCTEEDCIPVLEELSGLKFKKDFKVGYSPERINPGEKVHTLPNTIKIVSGCDDASLKTVAAVYETVVKPGVHRAPSIKVAEAAKIIENTQRDVNIALMNELSIIFGRIGINTYDVLEAAGTKWNFLKFYPGLVGGHCIGVDPYYLVHKANRLKYHPQIINAGRFVNDSMGGYIGKKLVKEIIKAGMHIKDAKVLVLGITFKENVSDIRNSKVVDIVKELESYGVKPQVYDPNASAEQVKEEYGISMISKIGKGYDAIVAAVAHKQFATFKESDFVKICKKGGVFVDVKGQYRNKIKKLNYWSL